MKALSSVAAAAALAMLATLPAILIAFRQIADRIAMTVPTHGSALDQAEFWFRAFGG